MKTIFTLNKKSTRYNLDGNAEVFFTSAHIMKQNYRTYSYSAEWTQALGKPVYTSPCNPHKIRYSPTIVPFGTEPKNAYVVHVPNDYVKLFDTLEEAVDFVFDNNPSS